MADDRSRAKGAHVRTAADAAAREAVRQEESLRERWEATQEALRQRLDEPFARASRFTRRTLAWFPVRVWRHFLQHNGFLLAAGVSYQALFAIFAVIYVAFAVVGLWLGGRSEAVEGLIQVINSYIPGLITESLDNGGLFTVTQVTQIATGSAGVLSVTGLIAVVAFMWTATGFVTFARRAVRDIFAIPPDRRNYVLLKTRDFFAALVFGVALLAGFVVSSVGTWALELLFDLFGWNVHSGWFGVSVRIASVIVSFALYAFALAALVRFLTGTQLTWQAIWPGAFLGGGAITILQLGAGLLISYTPTNPLLATFAIFVGLLLWFRIIGVILLVAASWIAVTANDEDVPLIEPTEAERLAEEHRALLLAAKVRLRTAREARATASWWRAWAADRAVRDAIDELHQVEAAVPPTGRVRPGGAGRVHPGGAEEGVGGRR